MGLMDRLKDMFTEEVEEQIEEEPIKKEVIQVEIPAPQQKEQPKEDQVPEKKPEKPAPIFFDDNDFAGLEQPKVEQVKKTPKILQKNNQSEKNSKKQEEQKKETKKLFKPTPIISPVYGILDKNYHKEDVKIKNNINRSAYNTKDMSIDDIRKKAYGTLQDDLEITLFGEPETIDIKKDDQNEIDMFKELMDTPTREQKNEQIDDSDLFNLIDSMYEKEDDKNGNG